MTRFAHLSQFSHPVLKNKRFNRTFITIFVVLCILAFLSEVLMLNKSKTVTNVGSLRTKTIDHATIIWRTADNSNTTSTQTRDVTVAIGCALSTNGVANNDPSTQNLKAKLPLFKHLVPSFCKTASKGFAYHFYIGHDHNDPYFHSKDPFVDTHDSFKKLFFEQINGQCSKEIQAKVFLHFTELPHMGHPAWAQSDSMVDAYLDGMTYFYRVNDDTYLDTPAWTEEFIKTLNNYDPPNVGVVGPMHSGGNTAILTYDFVHKTHLDIFGNYYPRTFTDWYADDWITLVYQPGRMKKLPNIKIRHLMFGQGRYAVDNEKGALLKKGVEDGKIELQRWLSALKEIKEMGRPSISKRISFSLTGSTSKELLGVVRNAQLIPVFFPEWTARIYVEDPSEETKYTKVPRRILDKLRDLKAEISFVPKSISSVIPYQLWKYLIADDDSVQYFIVRDVDSRLIERDATIVQDWIQSNKAFHCVRDHPSHTKSALQSGLIGGVPKLLKELFKGKSMLHFATTQTVQSDLTTFLDTNIWPLVKDNALCHDSISCKTYKDSATFPVARKSLEFVGEKFDGYNIPDNNAMTDALKSATVPVECTQVRNSNVKRNSTTTASQTSSTTITTPTTTITTPKKTKYFTKLWNINVFSKPIQDLKQLLRPLNVTIIANSLDPQCGKFNSCASNLEVINAKNAVTLSEDLAKEFYMKYKSDPKIASADAFLCMEPLSLCEAYMQFNKSMILIATSRYQTGRHEPNRWKKLNENLIKISKNPKNVIAANNLFDLAYLNYFTGIKGETLHSIGYHGDATFQGRKKQFLIAPISNKTIENKFHSWINEAKQRLKPPSEIAKMQDLYPNPKPEDLLAHQGIIALPTDVSPFSFFEYQNLNIPLFYPSLHLLTKWQIEEGILVDFNYANFQKTKQHSLLEGVSPGPDPNNEQDEKALSHWLKFALFYEYPHIALYDSMDDLFSKLRKCNSKVRSQQIKQGNDNAKKLLTQKWTKILERIKPANR